MLQSFLRETCRVCGSRNLSTILPLTPTPSGDAYLSIEDRGGREEVYPLDLLLCGKCAMSQLSYVVSPAILYGNFLYTTSVSQGLVEHFRHFADHLMTFLGPCSNRLAVDIGSNDGTLLRFLQERGLSVLGVEPAKTIAEQARQAGIETLPQFFSPDLAAEIRGSRGPAVLVTANNTMANIDGVDEFVRGVSHLLANDGLFAFETGYLVDIVDHLLFDTIYHEHLSYFLVHSLVELFSRNGMELIDIQRIPTKGGSVRGIAQLASGPRKAASSVVEALANEKRRGFHLASSYASFAQQVAAIKDSVHDQIETIHAKGQTVAGYGASVGVTTLLYYFDIAPRLAFLADDNPAKFNRFSPGHHVPVLPSGVLLEKQPDFTLILAWRYADLIIAKHQEYRERGGRFIRFLPNLEIV